MPIGILKTTQQRYPILDSRFFVRTIKEVEWSPVFQIFNCHKEFHGSLISNFFLWGIEKSMDDLNVFWNMVIHLRLVGGVLPADWVKPRLDVRCSRLAQAPPIRPGRPHLSMSGQMRASLPDFIAADVDIYIFL